jgi:hypothetical protein
MNLRYVKVHGDGVAEDGVSPKTFQALAGVAQQVEQPPCKR